MARIRRTSQPQARAHAVGVNDLHSVIAAAGPDACLSPHDVHMDERGNELLGAAIESAVTSPHA